MTSTLWGLPVQRVGALARPRDNTTAAMQPQHPPLGLFGCGGFAKNPACRAPQTKVPDRLEWICDIKHDGYRLIVQRDGKRL